MCEILSCTPFSCALFPCALSPCTLFSCVLFFIWALISRVLFSCALFLFCYARAILLPTILSSYPRVHNNSCDPMPTTIDSWGPAPTILFLRPLPHNNFCFCYLARLNYFYTSLNHSHTRLKYIPPRALTLFWCVPKFYFYIPITILKFVSRVLTDQRISWWWC